MIKRPARRWLYLIYVTFMWFNINIFDNFVWCDKNILKIVDIVIEKDPECSAPREEIRRFLLPISVVQYNKAFVGVRTTFLLVLKQIV